MREIKFRAWHKRIKVFGYPARGDNTNKNDRTFTFGDTYLVFEPNNCEWIVGTFEKIATEDCLNNPDVVIMQYTGVKDKNGEEIYEGDVIVQKHGEIKGVVKFRDGVFGVDTGKAFYPFPAYKDIEIIGNIHENPELLKEVIK